MKTSVIEVHDMLSVWSVDEVEERIGKVPGVESATVNYAAGSATVRYDETRLEIADIKSTIRQNGYESAAPAATSAGAPPPATPSPAAPKVPPVASASAGAAPTTAPKSAPDSAASPATAAPKLAPDAAAAPAGDEHKDKVTS
ncbi:MAG: heavy-metal-associated domain-containing protein [Nitrospirota bacterium]